MSLVEKLLTENQALGKQTRARPEPQTTNSLAYISRYINGHGQP